MPFEIGFLWKSLAADRADSVRTLAAGEYVIIKLSLGKLAEAVRAWLCLAIVDEVYVVILHPDGSIALSACDVLRLGPEFSTFHELNFRG